MTAVEKELRQQPDLNEKLYAILNETAGEIAAKLDAERQGRREPADHSLYNWASEIHHPCRKFLVHCRLDWRERQLMGLDGEWRVQEGRDKEWLIKRWMGDIGFELKQTERKFKTDDPGLKKFKNLRISGRIDGLISLNIELPEPFSRFKELPAEIKTISPHDWKSTETVEDIKKHSKFWINKIPSQLNTYFIFKGWPGGFLILATFGKKPRILPMLFDPDLWDRDKAAIRSVNKHVKTGTYPDTIPFDATVCGLCDFDHICQPLRTTGITELKDIDEVKLEFYLELKEWKDRFMEMHKELIGTMEKPGKYFGKEAFISDIAIKTQRSMRKKYPGIPLEVKKPFEQEYELIQTTIERIGQ